MVSIQLDSFDFDKLGVHQFNILVEQNNTSNIPKMVYDKMSSGYQHTYFLGMGSSPLSKEIPSSNHFDINHFQFQLSSVYEQIRNTNISTHSLLVVHSTSAVLQKLINFPCFYDIVQNRKQYNMGVLLVSDIFPKKFDILKKQLDYCIFGSILQEQELLGFVGPLFEPPYLYLQVHKTIYNENNYIVIIWNSTSNNLQDRIYWFEDGGSQPLPQHQQQHQELPSQIANPHQQVYQPSENANMNVMNTNTGNPSSLNDIDKQRIWKKIAIIEDLLADIKGYLRGTSPP
jgi:hypothetical protein